MLLFTWIQPLAGRLMYCTGRHKSNGESDHYHFARCAILQLRVVEVAVGISSSLGHKNWMYCISVHTFMLPRVAFWVISKLHVVDNLDYSLCFSDAVSLS